MIRMTPDLAQSQSFMRVTARLRDDLDRAALEAVTGNRADVTKAANGQLGQVHRVRKTVEQSDATQTRLALLTGRYTTAGAALKGVREAVGTFGTEALSGAITGEPSAIAAGADTARSTLGAVFQAMDTRFDGRSLFAGAAADRPALGSLTNMLSETQAVIGSGATNADRRAAIDAYFAPGGGFETSVYQGAAEDAGAVTLPNGMVLGTLTRADGEGVRDLIKGLTIIAHSVDLPPMEVTEWVRQGTDLIRAGTDALTREEARIGLSLNRLSEAVEREADDRLVAAETLDRVTGRDAYEAASETQGLETRLQAAYTLTSRLGRLSLTNYL